MTHGWVRSNCWLFCVVGVFSLVYLASLTFVYIEGDDASSIAYHALGRNAVVQPPYSPYQGGMDLLLSVLPAKEPILRVTAMSFTAASACLAVVLMLVLVFSWLNETEARTKLLFALALMAAMPEFFYLGLVYTPMMTGMCLVLVAHLLARKLLACSNLGKATCDLRTWGVGLASVVFFACGAACRWNLVLYGWVIFWDLFLAGGHSQNVRLLDWRRGYVAVAWGFSALVAWFGTVAVTGYGPGEMFAVAKQMAAYSQIAHQGMTQKGETLLFMIPNALPLFTPGTVILFLIGLGVLLWQKWRVGLVSLVLVLPLLGLAYVGNPKQYIAFAVPLAIGFAAGCRFLWYQPFFQSPRWLLPLLCAGLLLGPWCIGVRAQLGDNASGPGFERQPFDRPPNNGKLLALTLGAGAAFPTPEGPRPLFGHGAVLLGGQWRALATQLSDERQHLYQTAIREQLPLLILQGSTGYAVAELAGLGLTTRDPCKDNQQAFVQEIRHFDDGAQCAVTVLQLKASPLDFTRRPEIAKTLADLAGKTQMVAYGYPSSLRTLFKADPAAMTKLGPTTAQLDLSRWKKPIP
ncbi:MAG: hypothetical protein WC708_05800 [Lentisphaeria bacterium]